MENLAKSFCVLLDGIYQRDKEIAALQERLEAWKAYALAQKTAWDYTPTRQAFETIQQAEDRLKSLNEL